jgi:hydrogenase-4 component B
MTTGLTLAAPGLPLLLALLVGLPPLRRRALLLLPLAPLPGLALALMPGAGASVPPLLLGASLGLDTVRATFLGFAAFLWIMAGLFAAATMRETRRGPVFVAFWCITLAGNLGVFLAQDVATFYVAFAAVSLAATVLVFHDGTPKALAAGRLYLVLAVAGETALLAGLLIALSAAPSPLIADIRAHLALSPQRDLAVALLVIGFGLKAGLMPLHLWLPVAHPAAPTPASAALSGAIVKAGIFGLVAFLPADLPAWGMILVLLGLVSAFLAALLGLTQDDPKALLAYSTVSQMGLVIAGIGAALLVVDPDPALRAATLQSLHHGLAKAALFLSVGLVAMTAGAGRVLLLGLVGLLALSVAGLAPLGGGASKAALKAALPEGGLTLAFTLSGAGSALLLGRFLILLAAKPRSAPLPPAAFLSVLALAAAALVLPLRLLPGLAGIEPDYLLRPSTLIDGAWPILLAAALGLLARLAGLRLPSIPPGDIAHPLVRVVRRLRVIFRRLPAMPRPRAAPSTLRLAASARRAEARLARWPVAALALVLLVVAAALAAA